MIRLPRREPTSRTPEERIARAALLRQVLGPVAGWEAEWRADLRERSAIAELDGGVELATAESQATEAVRADLLRRLS